MSENQPVNFEQIAESFELALRSHDDVPEDAVEGIVATVEEACANNEQMLMWKSDYEQFMGTLDGVLDGIYGNGYDEQVKRLDDIRSKLEPVDE